MWHVADPSEYLVITGLFVKDIKIMKKAWVLVGQKCGRINVMPVAYEFQINARSSEKLEFILPANYTIGPDSKNMDSLRRYAKLVAPTEKGQEHKVIKAIWAIVEGQTRALAANMKIEEIFKGTEEFQRQVKELVQRELEHFGLVVYTANVQQLLDVEGRGYLSFLAMKAQKEAENKAKVDVAEATYAGDTGAKERDGQRERTIASVDAETAKYKAEQIGELERKLAEVEAKTKVRVSKRKVEGETAENQLEVTRAKLRKETAVAWVEAEKAKDLREAEMLREVQLKRRLAELEKARAEVVTESLVAREASQETAKAEQYKKEREAEAALFKRKAELEARQEVARTAAFERRQAAAARVSEGEAEAEVRKRRADAIAYTIRTLSWAVLHVVLALCLFFYFTGLLGMVMRSTPKETPSLSSHYVFTPKAIFNLLLASVATSSLPSSPFDPSSTSSSLPIPMTLADPPPSLDNPPIPSNDPHSPNKDRLTSNIASNPLSPKEDPLAPLIPSNDPRSPNKDPLTSNIASDPLSPKEDPLASGNASKSPKSNEETGLLYSSCHNANSPWLSFMETHPHCEFHNNI